MLVRERQRIPIDQTNSYLQYRTIIVDWMCEVAEEFKLNPYAVQLSVHYFDLALQRVKVKKSQLQLVAMCCTLLAGKLTHLLCQRYRVHISQRTLRNHDHFVLQQQYAHRRPPVARSQILRAGGTRAADQRLERMLEEHIRSGEDRADGGRHPRRAGVGHR